MSLYKRKDSSVWWVKFHQSGKVVQRSTGTTDKVKAQEYHDRLKASLWDQERLGIRPRYSWQQAAVRWIEETSHKATHKDDIAKLKWLHSLLGGLMLDEVTLDVIARIKEARLKVASKSTANRYLALVRAVLKRSVEEWEWLDKVPKVRLFQEPKGRTRHLSVEQIQILLQELPEHQRDIVIFALVTGMRYSNVVLLKWTHVVMEQRRIWVDFDDSKTSEFGKALNQLGMDVLTRQLGKHPESVFTYRGRPVKHVNGRSWRNALNRAGIVDFRWHDLRHTWASLQLAAGATLHELMAMGNWKGMAMPLRYAHHDPRHMLESEKRLDSLDLMTDGYDLATVAKK